MTAFDNVNDRFAELLADYGLTETRQKVWFGYKVCKGRIRILNRKGLLVATADFIWNRHPSTLVLDAAARRGSARWNALVEVCEQIEKAARAGEIKKICA